MLRRTLLSLGLSALVGCKGAGGKAPAPAGSKAATCAAVAEHLPRFGEVLEAASADAKTRTVTYAGLLELLLGFEEAASELDAELGLLRDAGGGDLGQKVKAGRAALASSAQFARTEREAIEKHARAIAPLAKETQQSWTALRAACDAKRGPPDCAGVRDVIARFDAAESEGQHEKAAGDLAALRLTTPSLVRARDRATQASRSVQAAIKARAEAWSPVGRRWTAVQKDLSTSMNALVEACRNEPPAASKLVAAEHPDPRKLTVLVHVRPPAAIERSLLSLARTATDEDERAFYQGRAEGAFGSGFFLVTKGASRRDVLVVTNRHVVELGERATLELADGTPLGPAEIIYANPTHDLAVLRPQGKLDVQEGFPLAHAPAKDQQTVIATGFPGMVGRPSYQTTKGYVSNESFKLDDGTRPLLYVQHTAPIDPGSSGGPLTDEAGRVLGVNTLKVTGREGVGLAVPSRYVIDTLHAASVVDARHGSSAVLSRGARLACLGFIAELGAVEPRMLVLEQMVSNRLVGAEGVDAAAALASDEAFERLWDTDSVRAMRIAVVVRLRAAFMTGGGPSVLETCDDVDAASARSDQAKLRVRLANFDVRELLLRWEQGRWKVDGFDARGARPTNAPAKKLPPPGPPAGARPPKRVAPPGAKKP